MLNAGFQCRVQLSVRNTQLTHISHAHRTKLERSLSGGGSGAPVVSLDDYKRSFSPEVRTKRQQLSRLKRLIDIKISLENRGDLSSDDLRILSLSQEQLPSEMVKLVDSRIKVLLNDLIVSDSTIVQDYLTKGQTEDMYEQRALVVNAIRAITINPRVMVEKRFPLGLKELKEVRSSLHRSRDAVGKFRQLYDVETKSLGVDLNSEGQMVFNHLTEPDQKKVMAHLTEFVQSNIQTPQLTITTMQDSETLKVLAKMGINSHHIDLYYQMHCANGGPLGNKLGDTSSDEELKNRLTDQLSQLVADLVIARREAGIDSGERDKLSPQEAREKTKEGWLSKFKTRTNMDNITPVLDEVMALEPDYKKQIQTIRSAMQIMSKKVQAWDESGVLDCNYQAPLAHDDLNVGNLVFDQQADGGVKLMLIDNGSDGSLKPLNEELRKLIFGFRHQVNLSDTELMRDGNETPESSEFREKMKDYGEKFFDGLMDKLKEKGLDPEIARNVLISAIRGSQAQHLSDAGFVLIKDGKIDAPGQVQEQIAIMKKAKQNSPETYHMDSDYINAKQTLDRLINRIELNQQIFNESDLVSQSMIEKIESKFPLVVTMAELQEPTDERGLRSQSPPTAPTGDAAQESSMQPRRSQ